MNKLIVFFAITATLAVIINYKYPNLIGIAKSYINNSNNPATNELLFTESNIALYNGIDRKELYLVILGKVYDVTKGASRYGPGKDYNTFIGRDNSKAFITGMFDVKDASNDVIKFSAQELRSLKHWAEFYEKDYTYIGKLIGRFYDNVGNLTPYAKTVYSRIKEAEEAVLNEELENQKFPPCNVEWDPKTGTRFWCTKRSGGISRDWVGVPRKLFEVGSTSYRCACISEENMKLGNIKEYENCEPNSESCFIQN